MTDTLESLLDGIERLQLEAPEQKVFSLEEVEDIQRREHILIEDKIKAGLMVLQAIGSRVSQLLQLYDTTVLKEGYNPKRGKGIEHTLKKMCIPCFTQLPADQPEYIQLLYASLHPNEMEVSLSFGEIIERALTLRDENAAIFFYELRRRFLVELEATRGISKDRWVRTKLPPRPWNDEQVDIYGTKLDFLSSIYRLNAQYQLMAHLVHKQQKRAEV